MLRPTARISLTVGLCLLVVMTLAAPGAQAKKKDPVIATYSGHTMNVDPGSVRGTNFLDVEINRWSTDEERNALLELLAKNGSEAMVKQMRDHGEKVGSVRLPGTVAYDLKYARQVETKDGMQLILATDRPLGMAEVRYNARTLDYGVTIIEFVMPSDGKPGDGTVIAGAELALKDNKLSIEGASMNPIRYSDIKKKKQK